MIPQYRTLKSKLPKYRLKKDQYRNTVNAHVPLYEGLSIIFPKILDEI